MDLRHQLDVDVVAVENEDEVALMLELTAPAAPTAKRAPATLQVVLDRSGSMDGERLEHAKAALDALVVRLDPTDHFGLVAFDSEVHVIAAAGPLTDKTAVRRAIADLHAGSMTNLSGGLLRGIQEARRATNGERATLLLLSDGHANEGVVEHAALQQVAGGAHDAGVAITTLGLGLDYDETLMSTIARGGAGNALFAEDPETAGTLIADEVDGLLTQAAQAVSLTIRPQGDVAGITLFNDLPTVPIQDGLMVELGDLYAEETRKLLLTVHVPAMAALGVATVAELELRWVELPALVERTATIPVNVNVVPGDSAAGRVPNMHVRTELEFQRAQQAKRAAGDALRRGDTAGAAQLFSAAGDALADIAPAAPAGAKSELLDEAQLLREMSERAISDDARRVSKLNEADWSRKTHKRGRG